MEGVEGGETGRTSAPGLMGLVLHNINNFKLWLSAAGADWM